jgi:hypothetical protein
MHERAANSQQHTNHDRAGGQLSEPPSHIPHSPALKWGTRLGALVIGLATVSAVPDNRAKYFGVVVVALIPLSLFLEPEILGAKYWRRTSPILVSIALLLGGLWVIRSPASPLGPEGSGNTIPQPSAKPSSSATPATPAFTIELSDAPLPMCNQLIGTGTIPPTQKLLIFDRPANASLTDGDEGATYYLDGPATNRPDGSGWSLKNVSVGAPGENIELVAELVSPELSEFFNGFTYSVPQTNGKGARQGPPGTTWRSTVLPPGKVVAEAFRQRDQTDIDC